MVTDSQKIARAMKRSLALSCNQYAKLLVQYLVLDISLSDMIQCLVLLY